MKRVSFSILGYVPTLGNTRHRVQIMRIFRNQAFEQRHDDVVLRDTGYRLRINVLGFSAVAAMENLLAVAACDAGFAPAAAGGKHNQKTNGHAKTLHALNCHASASSVKGGCGSVVSHLNGARLGRRPAAAR